MKQFRSKYISLCCITIIVFLVHQNFEFSHHVFENKNHTNYLSTNLATTARLGNHIFEIVSLYGISRTLNRVPLIFIQDQKYQKVVDDIRRILPGLVAKVAIFDGPLPRGNNIQMVNFGRNCCAFEDPLKLKNYQGEIIFMNGHFYQSFKYFYKHKKTILEMLNNSTNITNLPKSGKDNLIICVHIRRGDFVDGHHYTPNKKCIKKMLQFVIEKESTNQSKKVKIVLMGDDIKFESNLFPYSHITSSNKMAKENTTIWISANSPSEDLIYSRENCDVNLITAPSSTFGWWLGYLSKGQRVYYKDITSTNDDVYKLDHLTPEDFYPPTWIAIDIDKNGNVIHVNETKN